MAPSAPRYTVTRPSDDQCRRSVLVCTSKVKGRAAGQLASSSIARRRAAWVRVSTSTPVSTLVGAGAAAAEGAALLSTRTTRPPGPSSMRKDKSPPAVAAVGAYARMGSVGNAMGAASSAVALAVERSSATGTACPAPLNTRRSRRSAVCSRVSTSAGSGSRTRPAPTGRLMGQRAA